MNNVIIVILYNYRMANMLFSIITLTLHLQYKMTFVKIQQPVLFHFSEFKRQPAALDPKIIRKLLP